MAERNAFESAKENGDIDPADCGYQMYWVPKRGYLTAGDLRRIADGLDELNKDWDAQVKRDVGSGDNLEEPV